QVEGGGGEGHGRAQQRAVERALAQAAREARDLEGLAGAGRSGVHGDLPSHSPSSPPPRHAMTAERWPALPYAAWKDTYATLHMWMQVVGKVALAQGPRLNHSWGVAFQVTPRGLATRMLRHGRRAFTMEFDFVDHRL